MHTPTGPGVPLVALLVTLATASCLVGCGTDAPNPEPGPVRTFSLGPPQSGSPAAEASSVQDAVAAYRGMWSAYQAALTIPDPAGPDLAKYATGEALTTLTSGLQSVKDQGLKGEGRIVTSPRIVAAAPASQPSTVDIEDCLDDSGSTLVRAVPGPAFTDRPGGRRLTRATVRRQADRRWRVTSFGAGEAGTC